MIIPLITAPYISRVLGAAGIGSFSYARSIAYYFLILGMLGVNNHGSRIIAQVRDNKKQLDECFSELYSVQFAISSLLLFIFIVYFIILNNENRLLYISQLPYVLCAVFDVNWLFFGLEEFKITISFKLIIKIFTTACLFLFVNTKNDVIVYSWIMNVGYFISQCYLFLLIHRYTTFKKVNIKTAFKKHFKALCILFIPLLATSIYRVMDKIMIGSFANILDVGLYENADKIIVTCLGVVAAWGHVMLPRISNLYVKNNYVECKLYLRKSLEFINCITVGMAFSIGAIANDFVVLFYGKDFSGSGNLLCGLTITLIFIGWSNTIRNQVLIPMGRDNIYVKSVVLGAVTNLLINFSLIPIYGSIGALCGTVIAELMVVIAQVIPVKKLMDVKQYILDFIPFFIIGSFMFVLMKYFAFLLTTSLFLSIVIQIIFGGLFYLFFSIVIFNRNKESFAYPYIHRITQYFIKKYK